MKLDERQLLVLLAQRNEEPRRPFATHLATEALKIHPKRTEYLLEKWVSKGWWECGVSLRTGWLTEKGLAAAKE